MDSAKEYKQGEQEYRIAGWLGAMKVMARVGLDLYSRSRTKNDAPWRASLGYVSALCQALHLEPQAVWGEIIPTWVAVTAQENQAAKAAEAMGILIPHQSVVRYSFQEALDLFCEEHTTGQLDFRLKPVIDELSDYFYPQFQPNVGESVKLTKDYIEFYAGLYDPDRPLN